MAFVCPAAPLTDIDFSAYGHFPISMLPYASSVFPFPPLSGIIFCRFIPAELELFVCDGRWVGCLGSGVSSFSASCFHYGLSKSVE